MEGIHRTLQISIELKVKAYTLEPLTMKSEVRKPLEETTGVDKLPIELITAAGEAAITALCQQIWISNLWPKEWRRPLFLLLP
jgi:hypothetical protein